MGREMTEIHPDWQHHPIVAEAIRNSDGDPLAVLTELHHMCTELEARYPGLGFSDILAQPVEASTPFAYQQALVSQVYALHDQGLSARAISRALDSEVSYTTVSRWLLGHVPPGCITPDGVRTPGRPVPKYVRVAEFVAVHGVEATVAEFGCTKQYVYKCRNKVGADR